MTYKSSDEPINLLQKKTKKIIKKIKTIYKNVQKNYKI